MRHVIAVAALFAGAAWAAQQQPATDQQQTSSQQSDKQGMSSAQGGTHMTGRRAGRSQLASRMLREVHQARQAIAQNNRDQAIRQIGFAQKTFDRLNTKSSDQSGNAQNTVPIYQELEQISIIGPIRAAKQTSQAQSPESASADRMAKAPVVEEAAAEYTVMSLDTDAVKPHLDAAQAALKQGNLRQADAALQAIQAGVTVTSVAADLPLVRARQNLGLAGRMASQGRYQEAQASLQEAAKALNDYATTADGTRMAEVNRTRDEINAYANTIGQNHDGAADKISGWWDRTTSWASDQSQ